MKLKLSLLVLCLSTVFFGCKKDNGQSLDNAKVEIVGSWTLEKINIKLYDKNGTLVTDKDQMGDNKTVYYEFDQNVSKSNNLNSWEDPLPYTLLKKDGKLILDIKEDAEYEVTIKDGKMTMKLIHYGATPEAGRAEEIFYMNKK
jgi:hypothetical protein